MLVCSFSVGVWALSLRWKHLSLWVFHWCNSGSHSKKKFLPSCITMHPFAYTLFNNGHLRMVRKSYLLSPLRYNVNSILLQIIVSIMAWEMCLPYPVSILNREGEQSNMINLSVRLDSGYSWAASVERKTLNLCSDFHPNLCFYCIISEEICYFKTGFQLQQTSCEVGWLDEVQKA